MLASGETNPMHEPDTSLSHTTRIVIVDDDPVVRAHFRDIVAAQPTLTVTGEADCLFGAIELIATDPHLFLLDLGLPDGSGLDLIPVIRARCSARVLVVTAFGDRETVVLAPSGDSALKGEAKKPIAPGAVITIVIRTASGKSGQAKY